MVAPNNHCGPVANVLDNLARVGSVIDQIAQNPKFVPSLLKRLQCFQIGMDVGNDRDSQNSSATRSLMFTSIGSSISGFG